MIIPCQALLDKKAIFVSYVHELGFLLLEFHDDFLFVFIKFVSPFDLSCSNSLPMTGDLD